MVTVDGGDHIYPCGLACQGIGHEGAVDICINIEAADELSQIVVNDYDSLALHSIKDDIELAWGGVGVNDNVGAGVVVDEEGALHRTA